MSGQRAWTGGLIVMLLYVTLFESREETVSREELAKALKLLQVAPQEAMIARILSVVDADFDGSISMDDLKEVCSLYHVGLCSPQSSCPLYLAPSDHRADCSGGYRFG